MTIEDMQGIAEHCYREGCENWITGASDFCSPQCGEMQPHAFANMPYIMVHACLHCGKWTLHHVHTGDTTACTCDSCRKLNR